MARKMASWRESEHRAGGVPPPLVGRPEGSSSPTAFNRVVARAPSSVGRTPRRLSPRCGSRLRRLCSQRLGAGCSDSPYRRRAGRGCRLQVPDLTRRNQAVDHGNTRSNKLLRFSGLLSASKNSSILRRPRRWRCRPIRPSSRRPTSVHKSDALSGEQGPQLGSCLGVSRARPRTRGTVDTDRLHLPSDLVRSSFQLRTIGPCARRSHGDPDRRTR